MKTQQMMAVGMAFAFSLGCYRYVPATLEEAPAGSRVRALVSTEEQVRIQELIGVDFRILDGEVVELADETVMLSVPVITAADALATGPLNQRINVTRGAILRLDRRELDGVKTGLIATAGVGGVLAVLLAGGGETNQGTITDPGDGGEERISRWFLSIP